MRKYLALLLLPAFFCSNIVISTEKDIPLTTSQQATAIIIKHFLPIQMFMKKF